MNVGISQQKWYDYDKIWHIESDRTME